MKDLNSLMNNRIQIPRGITPHRKVEQWQDYAASICSEFKIDNVYKSRIFKMAKTKKSFLEGKVCNMRELKERWPKKYKSLELSNKVGNYFMSTFRNK